MRVALFFSWMFQIGPITFIDFLSHLFQFFDRLFHHFVILADLSVFFMILFGTSRISELTNSLRTISYSFCSTGFTFKSIFILAIFLGQSNISLWRTVGLKIDKLVGKGSDDTFDVIIHFGFREKFNVIGDDFVDFFFYFSVYFFYFFLPIFITRQFIVS